MANYNPAMTPQMAAQFHQQNAAMATPTNVYKITNDTGAAASTVKSANFPVQLGSSDYEDEKWNLQQKILNGNKNGVIPGMGQVIVGDQFFNYTKRKMEMAEEVAYRSWLMKQANFDSPEQAEYWMREFPWIVDMKLDQVNRISELQKQKAKINLTGPKTDDDWRFIYNEARGLIQVPTTPVHLLPKSDQFDNTNFYKRGLFSPMNNYMPPYDDKQSVGVPAYRPNFQYQWSDPFNITGFNSDSEPTANGVKGAGKPVTGSNIQLGVDTVRQYGGQN